MKKVAIALALTLGVFGSTVNAESAKKIPTLTLAMNSNISEQWVNFSTPTKANVSANRIELEIAKKMEQLSIKMDKVLEAKFSKGIDYAM